MPKSYSRQRKKSRGYKKYKIYKRCFTDAKGLAMQAWKGVKMLKGLVNVERHFYDHSVITVNNQTNTPTITVLNDIAAGSANDERNGTSILAKYLLITYIVKVASPAVAVNTRVMVVHDLQNHGVAPTNGELFEQPSNQVTSRLNSNQTDRFWILYDRVISLSVTGEQTITVKKLIPLNFHMKYDGPLSTDWETGSIFLVTVSDENTNGSYVSVDTRLAYYDN